MRPVAVDLRPAELTSEAGRLKRLLAEHGLLLLRGLGALTPPGMVEFMEEFGPRGQMGEYSTTPTDPTRDFGEPGFKPSHADGVPQVRLLGRASTATQNGGNAPEALLANIGYEWHQDGSGAVITMLYCRETPGSSQAGAATLFADSAALFDRLPTQLQEEVVHLIGVFSNEFTAGGPAAMDAAFGLRLNATGTRIVREARRRRATWTLGTERRPLASACSETGRVHLHAGAKNLERIEGMEVESSRNKLDEILRAALGPISVEGAVDPATGDVISRTVFDSAVVYEHTWTAGTALLWDNRRVLHSTTPVSLYGSGRRMMWQVIHRGASTQATLSPHCDAGSTLGSPIAASRQ